MLKWTRRAFSLLNTKVCSCLEVHSDIGDYLKEAPSQYNCIVTGAWGSGKTFAVDKSLFEAKFIENLIDIDFSSTFRQSKKPEGDEPDMISFELMEQVAVAVGAFISTLEEHLDNTTLTSLRTKLLDKGKLFYDTVSFDDAEHPMDKEEQESDLMYKNHVLDTVNSFIHNYNRVIRMTSWNWDQMCQILTKVSLADAYSIVCCCNLTLSAEELFEETYGFDFSETTFEVVSSLSEWLIQRGSSPPVLRVRDPEYFYYDPQLTAFFTNFMRALQRRTGNFYAIIEMNGIASPAFEVIAKDTRNINYEIRPATDEEAKTISAIPEADFKPEHMELLRLTGGNSELISLVANMILTKKPHEEIKAIFLKQTAARLKTKLDELVPMCNFSFRRSWLETIFSVDKPIERASAYVFSRVLSQPSVTLPFSHEFYSRNPLVQQISLMSILRYNWADQTLTLENQNYAPHLREAALLAMTQTRLDRFRNFLAFRSTWTK